MQHLNSRGCHNQLLLETEDGGVKRILCLSTSMITISGLKKTELPKILIKKKKKHALPCSEMGHNTRS